MSNLTEAEEKFLKHDWLSDKEWNAYFDRLEPTPPLKNVLKWKKKYYRQKVDPSFPADSTVGEDAPTPSARPAPQAAPQSASQPTASSASSGTAGPQPSAPRTGGFPGAAGGMNFPPPAPVKHVQLANFSLMAGAAGLLMVALYILPFVSFRSAYSGALMAFALSFLLDVGSKHGAPKWGSLQSYAQRVVPEDSAQMVMFCAMTFACPALLFVLAPPALTAAMNLSDALVARGLPPAADRIPMLTAERKAQVMDAVRAFSSQRYRNMQYRAHAEVFLAFFLIFVAVTRGGMMPCLLLWNFMRIRYMVSAFTQASFALLDAKVSAFIPRLPPVVATVYAKVKGFCYSYVDPAQQQRQSGGSSCTVQ